MSDIKDKNDTGWLRYSQEDIFQREIDALKAENKALRSTLKNVYIIQIYTPDEEYLELKSKTAEDLTEARHIAQRLRKLTKMPFLVDCGSRNIGVFGTFEQAEIYVLRNANDLSDSGYYRNCLIEEVELGGYPLSEEQWFYRWENDKWVKQDNRPNWAGSTVNFTIG